MCDLKAPLDNRRVTGPNVVQCPISQLSSSITPRWHSPHDPAGPLPRLYLLNAASIAKPHAIEQLAAEVIGLNIDVALITETHLKKHHTEGGFIIEGYTCLRRDRVGR